MISFPKVKATGWAIAKRLQGYRLLKNPKGVPQTEVNMVKSKQIISEHWDDITETERITKTFTENGSSEVVKSLWSKHFIDVDTLEMTKPRKKDINLVVSRDGVELPPKSREDIPWKQAENRQVPQLSTARSNMFIYDSEHDKMIQRKLDEQMNRRYYKTKYTLGQKIAAFGFHKQMFYPQENRPNFFRVLYQNLTNK